MKLKIINPFMFAISMIFAIVIPFALGAAISAGLCLGIGVMGILISALIGSVMSPGAIELIDKPENSLDKNDLL